MKKMNNNNDRGAVLIHVAMGLIALMAFSTFVIDYGVYWESRRQTQNAADAGAMAGAVALAYDDPTDASGVVAQSALNNGLDNPVWGQSPSIVKATDIKTPATGYVCPTDGTATCVRVDAYRSVARGNALPIFFGQLVNLASQDVQASAVGQVGVANASVCLMPWAVLDVDPGGNPYSVAADYGTQVTPLSRCWRQHRRLVRGDGHRRHWRQQLSGWRLKGCVNQRIPTASGTSSPPRTATCRARQSRAWTT